MNERIKLLAEQAKAESNQWLGSKPAITITYDELEKFAELIVKECVDWIDGSPTLEDGTLILGKHVIIDHIKGHFGVK